MLILTIRTDNPEAEIGLYQDTKQLGYYKWQAHRELAETLHTQLKQLLQKSVKDWPDVGGLVVYQGPGSFTGLRIGLSIANALAYGLDIPIVAKMGDGWLLDGTKALLAGKSDLVALPEYGAPVHITQQKK
jgi:tRNA threonylcarbamoyladenosine biosynthesis protein TsaB